MTSPKQDTLSRGDTGALIAFCLAGVAIAAYITIFSLIRIVTLLGGASVPVMVEFVDQPVDVPLGAGGADITLELDRAAINASALPPIAVTTGVIGRSSRSSRSSSLSAASCCSRAVSSPASSSAAATPGS